MAIWRYSGYLVGIPETILYDLEEDALRLFETGKMCEPIGQLESVAMANSLINSAPLIIGITDPNKRRTLSKYVFSVSRALIGNRLVDELNYPPSLTLGVLAWFRLQERFHRTLGRLLTKLTSSNSFTQFTSLLEASMLDEAGISYRLPGHVYAEEFSRW